MDFSHYNRDTAFGYTEDDDGEVCLTVYLGGDNVKEFSILTGGEADIVRLKQLIRGARLESSHIAGSDRKELIASKVLEDAGVSENRIIRGNDGICADGENLRIWLKSSEENDDAVFGGLEETGKTAEGGGADENGEADLSSDADGRYRRIELIMDADGIAKRLEDDTRLKCIRIVAYSHYGYDNNYTRAHEETEYILEHMTDLVRRKAAVTKGDFEIIVESVVKQGQGDRPGIIVDPEEQIFGAFYSYNVKKGELCISELNCDTSDGEIFTCPSCGNTITYCKITPQLKNIAEKGCICPCCGKNIRASELTDGLRRAEYFYRSRDLIPIYITEDRADCVGYLKAGISRERTEKYLQLAIDSKSHNCIAALLDYKKKHFENRETDGFDSLSLDDWDDFDDFDDIEDRSEKADLAASATDSTGSIIAVTETGSEALKSAVPVITDDGELIFGRYGRDMAPIVWKVLSVTDGNALIITKECIDSGKYNADYEKTTWETCTSRKWLNGEFLETAFTEAERALILDTCVRNPDNYFNRVNGGNDTSDKVFLLNIDEAEFYFDDRFKRQAPAGKEALSKRAYVAGTGYTAWWLRTPGADEVHASNVDYYGTAVNIGFLVNYTSNCIRPAMRISLNPVGQEAQQAICLE